MLPLAHRRIEACSFNALPATQTLLYDGWLLRLAGGGPRRANSISVLEASTLALSHKLRHCQQVFAAQDIPLTMRVTEHIGNAVLDEFLHAQGFVKQDETLVMSCDLSHLPVHGDAHFAALTPHAWFDEMLRLDGAGEARKRQHIQLLKNLALPAIYGSVRVDTRCAAIGLAVLDDEHVGLFDVNTDMALRRRGHARHLLQALMQQAHVQGARLAYLQVVAANLPAVALYTSLGFTPCYRYWYRTRP